MIVAINIIGITTDIYAYRKLALSWGVMPAITDEYSSIDILFYFAKEIAKKSGLVKKGDTIVIEGVGLLRDGDMVKIKSIVEAAK